MTGYKDYNRPEFHKWTKKLRKRGHSVLSPAEQDIKKGWHKKDPFPRKEALAADLHWICTRAQAIAMMPGWEYSTGATAEHATAKAIGIKIIYLGR